MRSLIGYIQTKIKENDMQNKIIITVLIGIAIFITIFDHEYKIKREAFIKTQTRLREAKIYLNGEINASLQNKANFNYNITMANLVNMFGNTFHPEPKEDGLSDIELSCLWNLYFPSVSTNDRMVTIMSNYPTIFESKDIVVKGE